MSVPGGAFVALVVGSAAIALLKRALPARAGAPLLAGAGLLAAAAVTGPALAGVLVLAALAAAPGLSGGWAARGLGALLIGQLLAWKLVGGAAPVGGRGPFPGYAELAVPAGLSFCTFRLLTLVAARVRGAPAPPAAELLAWLLFPPTFAAGPLVPLGAFQADLRAPPPLGIAGLNAALARLGVGLAKKFLLADPIGLAAQPVLLQPEGQGPLQLAGAVYACGLQLYLDFSALTDVAIALGRLLGVRVPENFDWPILAADLGTFWRRWHITLHAFFRDHLLLPVFGRRPHGAWPWVGLFTTVLAFQLWHELSARFLFLGLYHGLGVALTQAVLQARRRRPWLRALIGRAPRALGVAFVWTWFCAGNVVFMGGVGLLPRVLRALVAGLGAV